MFNAQVKEPLKHSVFTIQSLFLENGTWSVETLNISSFLSSIFLVHYSHPSIVFLPRKITRDIGLQTRRMILILRVNH